MHWDDGDGGAEVGTELMGEATADSNMGEEGSHHQPTLSALHCMPRGAAQPGNNVMARCPHDCLTNH